MDGATLTDEVPLADRPPPPPPDPNPDLSTPLKACQHMIREIDRKHAERCNKQLVAAAKKRAGPWNPDRIGKAEPWKLEEDGPFKSSAAKVLLVAVILMSGAYLIKYAW